MRPSAPTAASRQARATALARVGLLAVLSLVAASCREPGGGAAAIVLPDLADAEPLVVTAIETARDAVTRAPGGASAWGELGLVLHAHGFDAEAVEAYARARALDPDDYRWPYLSGELVMQRDPVAAVAHYDEAVRLAPGSAVVRQSHGDALMRAGRVEAARAAYAAALRLDERSRRALLGLAELALRERDLDRAEQLLGQARAIEFADREVHAKLARLHQLGGDDEQAAREQLLVRAYPDLAGVDDPARQEVTRRAVGSRAFTERGERLVAAGRADEAVRMFRQAVATRPEIARYRMNLANALYLAGQPREAIEVYEQGLSLDATDPDLHSSYAVLLAETGRLDEARRHLDAALEQDPAHADAHFNLGTLAEAGGRVDEAMAAYRRAIEHDPAHALARNNLGVLLNRSGRTDQAVEQWGLAVELDTRRPDPAFNLAVVQAQRGNFAAATSLLERALAASPNHVASLAALATIRATCPIEGHRNGAEAMALVERLIARTGSTHVPSLNLLAAAQAEVGDYTSAIETSYRALELAEGAGQTALVATIRQRLERYLVGRPYYQ